MFLRRSTVGCKVFHGLCRVNPYFMRMPCIVVLKVLFEYFCILHYLYGSRIDTDVVGIQCGVLRIVVFFSCKSQEMDFCFVIWLMQSGGMPWLWRYNSLWMRVAILLSTVGWFCLPSNI